jgi:hypothetical protein
MTGQSGTVPPCRLRQGMTLFALVKAGPAAASQFGVFEPVEHEQRALDLANFLQSHVQLVLPFIIRIITDGATWPVLMDANRHIMSSQCSRIFSVFTRWPRSGEIFG